MNYCLNKVEGFNPEEFIEDAKDRNGDVVIKEATKKPLRYLSTDGKILWFRLANPEGRFVLERIPEENPRCVHYSAEVYLERNDELPIAKWEHQETIYDDEMVDKTVSRVQTIALGKALSKAGFGCEIEAKLNLETEGEIEALNEDEAVPAAPTPKITENKMPDKVTTAEFTQTNMLDLAKSLLEEDSKETEVTKAADFSSKEEKEEKSSEEASEKAEEQETMTEEIAMETIVQLKEGAAESLQKHNGQKIKDILKEYPSFCSIVKRRERVQKSMNEDAVKAAVFIADHSEK